MPKSTKAAPPQQASLQEMWGKKKEPKVASKSEPDAMEVDVLVDKEGKSDRESSSSVTPEEVSAVKAENSKRKEGMAEVSSMFLYLYICCDTIDMP